MSSNLPQFLPQFGPLLAHVRQVHLVDQDHLGLLGEVRVEQLKLVLDCLVIVDRIVGASIHKMDQNPASLHMSQKGVPKAHAGASPLDQTRDVGEDESLALCTRELANTQIGHYSSEGVISDLGTRVCDGGNERRFARIRHAHNAHIRHQFELQRQPLLVPLLPKLRKLRNSVLWRLQRHIAPSPLPPPRNNHALPRRGKICNKTVGLLLPHHSAHRHTNEHVFPGVPMAPLPLPPLPRVGADVCACTHTR
mmetsp:Transcript_1421/g.3403  ORF Transcript_1421/g.3403 Transcript_1421/m.3403 type:complete len:251 (-) Transcript_1421:61-813(-)